MLENYYSPGSSGHVPLQMCSNFDFSGLAGGYFKERRLLDHSSSGLGEIKKKLKGGGDRRGGIVALDHDSCITQLKAQGPSRTCNESKKKKKKDKVFRKERLEHRVGT